MRILKATKIAGLVEGHQLEIFQSAGHPGSESWVVVKCARLPIPGFKWGRVLTIRWPDRKKWDRRGRLLPRPDGLFVYLKGHHDEVDRWLSQICRDGLMRAPEGTLLRSDGSLELQIEIDCTAEEIVSTTHALIDTCRQLEFSPL